MSSIQEKWKANQAKVAFAKQFPGLLKTWEECRGKKIIQIIPLVKHSGSILIMEDKTFTVVSKLDLDPADLQEGLHIAKDALQNRYAEAYAELEHLTAHDLELTRRSRLEKILGAVQNNMTSIPELKQELKNLLSRLPD
jgi:diglucosylglycerate octanoyltransferase